MPSRLLSDAACVLFDCLLPVNTMGPSLCKREGSRSRSDSRETLSEGKATHFLATDFDPSMIALQKI